MSKKNTEKINSNTELGYGNVSEILVEKEIKEEDNKRMDTK